MTLFKKIIFIVCAMSVTGMFCYAQTSNDFNTVPLNSLQAFRNPGKNWVVASDAIADLRKDKTLRSVKGEGVLVNTFKKTDQMHLITNEEYGDIELELDFMMAKNSNSGIYLMGRYEIQLLDSWRNTIPTSSDLGAVYMRYTGDRGGFEGAAPAMNVAKAPGLWQHLNIRFKAPKFNEKGEKTANAKFESVHLNGVLILQEVQVTGPTISSMLHDEQPKGPVAIQGDHGPVAIRNLRVRPLTPPAPKPERDEYWIPGSSYWNTVDQIIVRPEAKPALIRTFMMHQDKKLTHVISVGNPNEVNYSYDVKQGALFQVWRGKFLDATPSWRDRGGMQISQPLGSLISLSDAPAIAVLESESAAWPDSVAFDTMQNKGFVLDKKRNPSFQYFLTGMKVTDKILTEEGGEGLARTITVENAHADLYCRIAVDNKIEKITDDLFAVGDKSYYIRIDKKRRPVIRQTGKGQEMIVRYDNSPLTYSLIW